MYDPKDMTLEDGDPFRDIYALGVIIFKVIFCKDIFIQIRTRKDIMTHVNDYVIDKTKDDILTQILNGTLLCKEVENQLSLLELGMLVSKMIE